MNDEKGPAVIRTSERNRTGSVGYTTANLQISLRAAAPFVSLLLLSAIGGLARAHAHSWYPQICCNDKDCRVVDKVDALPDGAELFHAGSITVVVPRHFKRMPSQDSQVHLCFYRVFTGEYRPRCVFVPGDS